MPRRVVPPRRKEEREREENIARLAGILDIGPKALTKLRKKYDLKLEATLERWYKETREVPKWMANQNGHYHPAQYVTSPYGSIDDQAETIPSDDQEAMVTMAHARWAERERAEKAVETARADADRVARRLKGFVTWAARNGQDPTVVIAGIERVIRANEDSVA